MKQLEINFQKQLKHYMLDMKVSMNGGCLGILGVRLREKYDFEGGSRDRASGSRKNCHGKNSVLRQ